MVKKMHGNAIYRMRWIWYITHLNAELIIH